jgi:histidinol-phosphate aminotransferase
VGLLDYYKQFEGMTDREVSARLRAEADERRRKSLERVEPLDLSGTTWHAFPHPDVVAAVTYAARRGINRYADPHAGALRRELSARHGVEPERIVIGNGAAELLVAAAHDLLASGDELVTPWPSYPLYPLMARRAGAKAVPVPGHDPDAILGAVTGDTRMVVLCNPNDPTGHFLSAGGIDVLLRRLPERAVVVVDEALRDYADAERPTATLDLLDDHPRLILVRTFSKAFALAGLRVGYALGGVGSEALLEHLEPPLGVGTPAQAGALEALRKTTRDVEHRARLVATERVRLADQLADLGVEAAPSQSNTLWISAPGIEGEELATRMDRLAVKVKPGATFGATDHVRAQVRDQGASERLTKALELALATSDQRPATDA